MAFVDLCEDIGMCVCVFLMRITLKYCMYIYIHTFFACTFAYYMHMGSCLQNLLSQYRYVYVYIYLYLYMVA